MATIGYHASHEQFSPSDLLQYVQAAERAGFEAAMCSDHFHPWTPEQGNSGFAWAWLGAALQATGLSFGTVSAPGYRYHPAVLAQAAATLSFMYPGRFWLAVGSGEALNEGITGGRWPAKDERNARLRESVDVMRALWAGETVTHRGLVTVENARLYTTPPNPPRVFAAAITPATARWAAPWADGLITIAQEPDKLREVIDAFREGGGEAKPMALQVHVCHADTLDEARRLVMEQWSATFFESPVLAELRLPSQFSAAAELVSPAKADEHVRLSTDAEQHVEWLGRDIEMGFERIYLHHVGPDQHRFIETFGEKVLPAVRKGAAAVA
jgi:coenzyme F420-dependent glucose-6-phosphate dehydrogenase